MRALDCRKFGNIVFSNEMITIPDACKLINGVEKPSKVTQAESDALTYAFITFMKEHIEQ